MAFTIKLTKLAEEEEEVVLDWQKKRASELQEDDFTDTIGRLSKRKRCLLSWFYSLLKQKKTASTGDFTPADISLVSEFFKDTTKGIRKQVDHLDKTEQLDILMNDHPELVILLDKFKQKLNLIQDELIPALELYLFLLFSELSWLGGLSCQRMVNFTLQISSVKPLQAIQFNWFV